MKKNKRYDGQEMDVTLKYYNNINEKNNNNNNRVNNQKYKINVNKMNE